MPRPSPGAHRLPHEFITRNQKARISEATITAIAAKGYRATTVADIVAGAGIARNTFYENFGSKEDAFDHAFGVIAREVGQLLAEADSLELKIAKLVLYVHEHRSRARCVLLEAPGAIPEEYEARLTDAALETGLGEAQGLMVIGGVASVFYKAVLEGQSIDAAELHTFVAPHFEAIAA